MRNRDTHLPMNERQYSVSYTIPIPTPTDIDSFDMNDIWPHHREFRTKEEMLQFVDILQQGDAENVTILYYPGETYEKNGNHYAVKENVTEQYYQNPVVDFYIFEEDMCGTSVVAETDATTRKYSDILIKAHTSGEACEIYFETRGISPDETWRYSAGVANNSIANKALLKSMGYSSWAEYDKDMYPERPIEL